MTYTPRTTEPERELLERRSGHYALRGKDQWFIYVLREGAVEDRMVATSADNAAGLARALGIIRHRRDAWDEADRRARRDNEATIQRLLAAGRPTPTPALSGSSCA